MHRQLLSRLVDLGRESWLTEDCNRLLAKAQTPADPEQSWKRINGSVRLDGISLAVLQALATWRDKEAERRNLARGFVIKDVELLTISNRKPRSMAALADLDIWHPNAIQRHGSALLKIIDEVQQTGQPAEPLVTLQQEHRQLMAKMQKLVKQKAQLISVEPALLASKRELEALILSPSDEPLPERFLGWRKAIITEDLMELKGQF